MPISPSLSLARPSSSLALTCSVLFLSAQAFGAQAVGSGPFGPQVNISSTALAPHDAASIDLDGDGDLDWLLADPGQGAVLQILNLGAGRFATAQRTAIPVESPHGLAVFDANGDGDEDLLLGEEGTASPGLKLFLGDGAGSFTAAGSWAAPIRLTHRIELRDVDADGDLDALLFDAHGPGNPPALVAFQRGPSEFVFVQPNTAPFDERRAVFEDMNGDGNLDLVTTISSGLRGYFPYAGNESFSAPVPILNDGHAMGVRIYAPADFDGDGDVDLLVALLNTASWTLVESLGAQGFAAPVRLAPTRSPQENVEVIDMDGDGDLDLLGTGSSGGRLQLEWLENLGGLSFSVPHLLGIDDDASSPRWTRLDHGTSSTSPDLVMGGNGGQFSLVRGVTPGAGTLAFGADALTLTDQRMDRQSAALVDWDGDGDVDILSAFRYGALTLAENVGPGRFQRPIRVPGPQFIEPIVADVDGDGAEDVVGRSPGGRVAWLRNDQDGQGTYAPIVEAEVSMRGGEALLDIDQDGLLDVIAIGRFQRRLLRVDQTAPGVFGVEERILSSPTDITCVRTADMDGDGLTDIVIVQDDSVTTTGQSFFWFRNLGGGQLSGRLQLLPFVEAIDSFEIFDLDGSPTPELVWLDYLGRQVMVAQGGSSAAVQSPVAVQATMGQGRRVALDRGASGAGRDLIVASRRPVMGVPDRIDRLRWLGGIQFGPSELITDVAEKVNAVALADLDGDGDLDLVSASEDDGRLAWYAGGAVESIGVAYCNALANSTGRSGELRALGSASVASNDLRLVATELPTAATTLFLASMTTASVPMAGGSAGTLCLGGQVGRFLRTGETGISSADGSRSLTVDLASIPQPTGFVAVNAGQSWSFQAWHRDIVAGMASSNFTGAVTVSFL